MLGKYLKSKINIFKKCRILKKEKGMTLVEIVIAFLILSLVSLAMVQSVMIAIRATEINKSKTEAIALANMELEEIRLRDYDEVGIIGASGSNPEGSLESESVVDYHGTDYTVRRTVTWVEGEYSYKQIEISAVNDKMPEEISIVTQLYPEFGEGGPPLAPYPPVRNLTISGFWLLFWFIELNWDEPETETIVDYYEIYRDGSQIDTTNLTRYSDSFFDWRHRDHTYYVIVVYADGYKSDPSDEVSTEDL